MTVEAPLWASDRFVELLTALGYEYVAFNPGASFRGLHDSLANVPGAPRIITTTHEEIAVAIAHGYAKAAGRPMAAALHNIVGLQHASMAIFNAFCDEAPVMLIGGTGPVDAAHRRPFIDWVHTALVQGTQVRDYVRWDDQPASYEAAIESLIRADRIARAEPPGPVYVCIDTEIAEAEVDPKASLPDLARFPAARPPAADPAALAEAANWLAGARSPIAVADLMGRSVAAVRALAGVAEHLGMPVLDLGARFNFPSSHPLDWTVASDGGASPDVALLLDVIDPNAALRRVGAMDPDGLLRSRVISISTRELGIRSWAAHYQRLAPADLAITAASDSAVPALLEACLARPRPTAAEARLAAASATHELRRTNWLTEARAAGASGRSPIALSWLTLALREALGNHPWSLVNGPLESPWPRRLWQLTAASQWLGGSGGAGIGYGIGASVGAALAFRGTGIVPVDLQGDGDLMYSPGAIWTAVHERIPLLIVVQDNRAYQNSRGHAVRMAERRGRPDERAGLGTTLTDPVIDLAGLARSMGATAYGPVTDPLALPAVLARAVDEVVSGAVVLVDVVTEAR